MLPFVTHTFPEGSTARLDGSESWPPPVYPPDPDTKEPELDNSEMLDGPVYATPDSLVVHTFPAPSRAIAEGSL
jgi:hypothetical protein